MLQALVRLSSPAEEAEGRGRIARTLAPIRGPGLARGLGPGLALLTGALAGCGGEARAGNGALSGTLTVTGSSTIAPLASEIGKRFEELHSEVRIDVQTGGSSRGIADARRGLADVGASSRALTPGEAEGLETHVVALDGVGFLVHASNPVGELTEDELRAIFTGRVDDWSEVGGSPGPITVIDRTAGRSEVRIVSSRLGIDPADFTPDLVAGDNEQGIRMVAGDPSAITYLSVGSSEVHVERGTPVALLSLGGVPAASATVASGAYPCSRPLVLVCDDEPSELVRAWIDYATSDAVADLIVELGYVPPRSEGRPAEER